MSNKQPSPVKLYVPSVCQPSNRHIYGRMREWPSMDWGPDVDGSDLTTMEKWVRYEDVKHLLAPAPEQSRFVGMDLGQEGGDKTGYSCKHGVSDTPCPHCWEPHTPEPPEPDGECYRGSEYAASVRDEMAEARKLK